MKKLIGQFLDVQDGHAAMYRMNLLWLTPLGPIVAAGALANGWLYLWKDQRRIARNDLDEDRVRTWLVTKSIRLTPGAPIPSVPDDPPPALSWTTTTCLLSGAGLFLAFFFAVRTEHDRLFSALWLIMLSIWEFVALLAALYIHASQYLGWRMGCLGRRIGRVIPNWQIALEKQLEKQRPTV